jgi:hypothetical protein
MDSAQPEVGFSAFQGGLVCGNCRNVERVSISVSGDALEQLRCLAAGKVLPRLNREAEDVLDGFLQYVLERDIKSNQLLGSVN